MLVVNIEHLLLLMFLVYLLKSFAIQLLELLLIYFFIKLYVIYTIARIYYISAMFKKSSAKLLL